MLSFSQRPLMPAQRIHAVLRAIPPLFGNNLTTMPPQRRPPMCIRLTFRPSSPFATDPAALCWLAEANRRLEQAPDIESLEATLEALQLEAEVLLSPPEVPPCP